MSNHPYVHKLLTVIFIVISSGALAGCASSSAPVSPNLQGLQGVLQTEFVTLQGSPESLANHSGKIVLLHFFSSWCPDCAREAPSLKNLSKAFTGADFQIIGVAIDDDPFEARSFASRFGLPFPVILDTQGELKNYFSIKDVPTTIFLDRMGVPVTFQDPETGVTTAKLSGARRWDTERPVEMIAGMIEAR
jgi:thiol-disulfide isomerase/thioredoxin